MDKEIVEYYEEVYKEKLEIDDEMKKYIENNEWEELMNYCYEKDKINEFKMVYLMSGSKFKIDYILEMEKTLEEKIGGICKPRWTNKGLHLEVTKVVLNEENKKKYGAKLDMIKFIVNCRQYSQHILMGRKFYYRFKINKYGDRIEDILREM